MLLKAAEVSPISIHTDSDYMKGKIDSVLISGMVYNNGLIAEEVLIENPQIAYTRVPVKNKPAPVIIDSDTLDFPDSHKPLDLITPYFGYLVVENIHLNKGNITYTDKLNKRHDIYQVSHLDFHAGNVLIDANTIKDPYTYFKCDDYNFSFKKTNNQIGDYHIGIDEGTFTGNKGHLSLKNLQIIPREEKTAETPATLFRISTPSIEIKGIEHAKKENTYRFSFTRFLLTAPDIGIIKEREPVRKTRHIKESVPPILELDFKDIHITDFTVGYKNNLSADTLQVKGKALHVSSLQQKNNQDILLGEIFLQTSSCFFNQATESDTPEKHAASETNKVLKKIKIQNIHIRDNTSTWINPAMRIEAQTNDFTLRNLSYHADSLDIGEIFYPAPVITIHQKTSGDTVRPPHGNSRTVAYSPTKKKTGYYRIGQFDMPDAEIDYLFTVGERTVAQQKSNATDIYFSGLQWNRKNNKMDVDDLKLTTENLQFPVDNGFYTLLIKKLDLDKKRETFRIDDIHLKSTYEKDIFAYYHPQHKDWFDVKAGSIEASGINFERYLSSGEVFMKYLAVNDAYLLNYKNQHIEIEHHIMPMIYEGLQKLPVPVRIDKAEVNNLYVEYEELPKNKDVAGRIFFTDMYGTFSGFTNIVSFPDQYIRLDANGKLMGDGAFHATWLLPVDSLNDHFRLTAHIRDFNLVTLNELLIPMATAKVERGLATNLFFNTDASSKDATVQMLFLYNNLNVSLLKEKDGELKKRKFLSWGLNLIVRDNNPSGRGKPRQPDLAITRDPYHSTFNYLWQILQPPLIESVGVSQHTQKMLKGVSGFFKKVKTFFTGKK